MHSAKTWKGMTMYTMRSIMVLGAVAAILCTSCAQEQDIVASGAKVKKLAGDFQFTEGPAADAQGDIYFTDIPANRILKWSISDSQLSTFREDSGGANGLYFDKDGNLLVCEGDGQRLVSITPDGTVEVLAGEYEGQPFNSLNDLWIDPNGGVYFTDPHYGDLTTLPQGGEHVYYLTPDRSQIVRVVDDMVRPNGLIGTPDGQTLYITDEGGDKTYVYTINVDGTLSDKKLFCSEGSDGMTIDNQGNVYLTPRMVSVYTRSGEKIREIQFPEQAANVTFGGKNNRTLFVTARTSLYSLEMQVAGAETPVRGH